RSGRGGPHPRSGPASRVTQRTGGGVQRRAPGPSGRTAGRRRGERGADPVPRQDAGRGPFGRAAGIGRERSEQSGRGRGRRSRHGRAGAGRLMVQEPVRQRGRALFIFVDGVGLGPSDPEINPFASARLLVLTELLGRRRPLASTAPLHTPAASLVGLDARLGVPGQPQSGTGQAALLTGLNAPKIFGRHYGPWTPTVLRAAVAERSILARAVRAGRRVAFANAYPEEVLEPVQGRGRSARFRTPLRAGPPLAALGAGVLTRHTAELARGEAV